MPPGFVTAKARNQETLCNRYAAGPSVVDRRGLCTQVTERPRQNWPFAREVRMSGKHQLQGQGRIEFRNVRIPSSTSLAAWHSARRLLAVLASHAGGWRIFSCSKGEGA